MPAHSPALARVTLTATLVAWLRAWRAGFVAVEDVIAHTENAVQEFLEHEHMVIEEAGAPSEDRELSHAHPFAPAISELSHLLPEQIRLVLPAAGNTRGLPVVRVDSPAEAKRFVASAMDAGAAAMYSTVHEDGVAAGTVGLVVEPVPGRMVTWRRFTMENSLDGFGLGPQHQPREEHISVAEADATLLTALREITVTLDKLDLARHNPGQAARLAELRERGAIGPDLPTGYPHRNRALLARAAMVLGIAEIAGQDSEGGAVNSHQIATRLRALRDITAAARDAYVTAINVPFIPPAETIVSSMNAGQRHSVG